MMALRAAIPDMQRNNLLPMALVLIGAIFAPVCGGAEPRVPVKPYEAQATFVAETQIDKLVSNQLKRDGIQSSYLCSDAVFVRRVYLDAIGSLPTAEEARSFILDTNTQKRAVLIDRLLEREEFAEYWAMKWSDLLRVKAEFPINLWPNAAQAYHRWIRSRLKENVAYDQFVREILTGSGSNFRVPQVNFYRAMQSREPQAIAQAVALNFMGVRADKWPQERLSGMAVFFSQIGFKSTAEWKEEIVYFDPDKLTNQPLGKFEAVFPDGKKILISRDRDPREVFAEWLIDDRNPWFARNIVNRIWSWIMGQGIINEPDDIRPDNPPQNPELLRHLERELIGSDYDLKHIYRLILNSKTYQLSSIPVGQGAQVKCPFACYPLRRLEAEVLIDALCQITGTTENYASAIPEPFTFVPEGQRSIGLPDGSITSPFLEMFGRPPRDTGLESERNNRITASQRLHLLNSSHVRRKIEQSVKLQRLRTGRPGESINNLFLSVLSRYPTEQELQTIGDYLKTSTDKKEAVVDVVWALINSPEFLYRH